MLELRPITLRDAAAFVHRFHRHSPAPVGGRFAISALEAGELVGVVIVGRPVARALDDGTTAELIRVCVVMGAQRGACSRLMRAAWRAWAAMGGRRLVTYTLATESGASLRGAGFQHTADLRARSWGCQSRPRSLHGNEAIPKRRWELRADG